MLLGGDILTRHVISTAQVDERLSELLDEISMDGERTLIVDKRLNEMDRDLVWLRKSQVEAFAALQAQNEQILRLLAANTAAPANANTAAAAAASPHAAAAACRRRTGTRAQLSFVGRWLDSHNASGTSDPYLRLCRRVSWPSFSIVPPPHNRNETPRFREPCSPTVQQKRDTRISMAMFARPVNMANEIRVSRFCSMGEVQRTTPPSLRLRRCVSSRGDAPARLSFCRAR